MYVCAYVSVDSCLCKGRKHVRVSLLGRRVYAGSYIDGEVQDFQEVVAICPRLHGAQGVQSLLAGLLPHDEAPVDPVRNLQAGQIGSIPPVHVHVVMCE